MRSTRTALSGTLLGTLFVLLPLLLQAPAVAYADDVNAQNQLQLRTMRLMINQHAITAEIADTEENRMLGLMYRLEMASEHGMLFVFSNSQVRCFWMKNTLIPLTIAYIDEHRKIVSLHDMYPHNTESVCSLAPAKYALEMNQNWFATKKIKIGDTIQFESTQP